MACNTRTSNESLAEAWRLIDAYAQLDYALFLGLLYGILENRSRVAFSIHAPTLSTSDAWYGSKSKADVTTNH